MKRYIVSENGKTLNTLGYKYVESISSQQFDKKGKFDLGKRTGFQISTANRIISDSRPLMHMVAHKMLYGDGWRMGHGGRLSLKGFYLKISDLVSEGTIGALENMHRYNHERGSMTTFIGQYAAARMFSMGTKYTAIPLVRGATEKIRAAIKESVKSDIPFSDILKSKFCFGKNEQVSANTLEALAIGVNLANTQSIDEPAFRNDPKSAPWQAVYLKDDKGGPEDYVAELDIVKKVKEAVLELGLSERDMDIIKGRNSGVTARELGEKYSITRQGVDKIRNTVMKKLRRPLKKIALDY